MILFRFLQNGLRPDVSFLTNLWTFAVIQLQHNVETMFNDYLDSISMNIRQAGFIANVYDDEIKGFINNTAFVVFLDDGHIKVNYGDDDIFQDMFISDFMKDVVYYEKCKT